jgi:hypothetical protein
MLPFRGGLLLVGDSPRGPGNTAYTLLRYAQF